MKVSKKKLTSIIAGSLAVAAVVGSFAYYSSTSSIDNPMHTEKYGNRTVEEFTPNQKVEPGAKVDKIVGVENTGNADLVVRIKMDEKWERNSNRLIAFSSNDARFSSVVNVGSTYTATQRNDTDGLLTGDESVVYKKLSNSAKWRKGNDGYWYYNELLTAGKSTDSLLEELIFASNMDMGRYVDSGTMYSTTEQSVINPLKATVETAQRAYDSNPTAANESALNRAKTALDNAYAWTATKPARDSDIRYVQNGTSIDNNARGYADADYTLTITTETCQATSDAVTTAWSSYANSGVTIFGLK